MQQYVSRRFLSVLLILALLASLVVFLVQCGKTDSTGADADAASAAETTVPETAQPTATPEPKSKDPYDAVKNYWSEDQLTQAWGPDQVVEHLFFHPIIAYPKYAFYESGASQAQRYGLDDWMVTVDEYKKIIQSVYDKGYILVAMEDIWSEVTDDSGTHMVRNTLMLPEGKKPLVISFDDVNYYPYMLEEGFTSKLVVGDDGEIWAECVDPYSGETFNTKDLDATPILDQFVYEHPDFSLNGAKAIFSLTGYEGVLGYRTQIDSEIPAGTEAEYEANRQKEIEAVKPVIARLKETGWTFGSHTWGHINLAQSSTDLGWVQKDTQKWLDEVGSLVGPTNILFYPHGARPDGDDWHTTGPKFRYLHDQGFRIFASVGVNSFSYIKEDISAVICDRLHPDGTTLRSGACIPEYSKFYDTYEVFDPIRPDLGNTWPAS